MIYAWRERPLDRCPMMNHVRRYRLFYYAVAVAFLIGRSMRTCSTEASERVQFGSLSFEDQLFAE